MAESVNIANAMAELRQDFRAAKVSRFTPRVAGVSSSGSGADYHYRSEYDYLHIIERSRHYERNDGIIGQAIRRLVSNVIQQGFLPDPQTGDDDLNRVLKELWEEWSLNPDLCHSEGELTFHQIERLSLRSTVRDGDIFHLLLDDGSMQPVEGHRPRSPMRTQRDVVNGILLDKRARRNEVWIAKEDISPYMNVGRVSELEKYAIRDPDGNRQVLQVYFPDRFSQRRGIGTLAPCADIIGMHDDLQFTTLVKAQLASLLVILREQNVNSPAGISGPPIGNTASGREIQLESGGAKQISGISAGLDYVAPPGQTVKGFTPNIPNPEFFPHTSLLLTFISVNLDLPLQVLLLDPQRSSFSSWRGAIDQARVRFREIQADVVNQLHRPTWSWKVRQWLANSLALRRMAARVENPGKNNWKKPAFAYIEPNKDAQADSLQQEKFLSSPRRLHGARGNEYREVAVEAIEDRKLLFTLAMTAAKELAEEHDVDVSWRDILSPDFGSSPRAAAPAEDPNAEDSEENPDATDSNADKPDKPEKVNK